MLALAVCYVGKVALQDQLEGDENWKHKLCAVPADGGELRLLLNLFSKHLQLLLEWLFVVVWMNVVIVWNYRGQELGAGETEQLFKHLNISEREM